MMNIQLLMEEFSLAGLAIVSCREDGSYDFEVGYTPTAQELIDADAVVAGHDPNLLSVTEKELAIKLGAKDEIRGIPNYATWTTAHADSWLETNVTDLASAKVALKAIVTMVIAMRNELYPDLQE